MADKFLFTPGPLSTTATVKQAALRDLGSRDDEFLSVVLDVRRRLLEMAEAAGAGYEAIPMQGSGTFAVESVLGSLVPEAGKLLVVANGAYGERMAKIASMLRIAHSKLALPEWEPVSLAAIDAALDADPAITHLGVIHCETSTGLLNDVESIGARTNARGVCLIVDAMSSLGGVPLNVPAAHIDAIVSSANKCVQGIPGFGFAIVRRSLLEASEGVARSLSLDLVAQWKGLEANGQFRFTPPVQALLAFHQALLELEAEGGVAARAARYAGNHQTLEACMAALGFVPYLDTGFRSHIISAYRYPEHPSWNFEAFYRELSDEGFVIYPGKVSNADCFRIGTIGNLYPQHIEALCAAMERALARMGAGTAGAPL
ncbi:MAG: 2-aminoethylphosphonate--pyruvate transaminase [Bryobacterales bacterium]|nr:2-aminoethylphosphonate--pyruvate transaminase [Bryobacterales bacterium]